MHSRLLYERMLENLVHVGYRNEFDVILDTVRNVAQIPLVIFREQYFL